MEGEHTSFIAVFGSMGTLCRGIKTTMVKEKRIGVMGGTFNPIHLGHLLIAEVSRETFALDKVIFVPAAHPPHKHADVLEAHHRYTMVEVAVLDNPYFTISDIEMKREGPSYTIDTIRAFREEYGADTRFFFIAGTDTIQDLPNWKYIDELLEMCDFIGVVRPDGSDEIEPVLAYFGELGRQKIHRLEVPSFKISATELRQRLRTGRTVRYMMPKSVVDYIKNHDIYVKRG